MEWNEPAREFGISRRGSEIPLTYLKLETDMTVSVLWERGGPGRSFSLFIVSRLSVTICLSLEPGKLTYTQMDNR